MAYLFAELDQSGRFGPQARPFGPLFDMHARWEPFGQLRDVRDDANEPAADGKREYGLGHSLERLGVERAEALVDEEAVEVNNPSGALDLLREFEGKGQ